ncbi:MAG: MarR family transcriptional regulator [Chitinophagaceae bacterium]|nr:MarR family transcriptional regulator [Chitinophagaceae bacterium]MCW5904251.1 MarR family transcriptional regulator [Chitinophagaceae bacterium]
MELEQAIQSKKFRNEVHKAGLNILYTAWWLRTITCKELKDFGLTPEQYNVLRILKGKHPNQMCVKDIACRMIEKNSNVPRIIDRLEDKKLVSRNQGEEDGRQTVIELTQAGISILASSTVKINELYDNMLTINNTEAESLNNLLEKVREKEA